MKSALKFYSIIALLAVVCTASAQTTYRLEIGYNNPKRYFSSDVSSPNIKGMSTHFNGVKLGGTAEFKLKNNFSLLTGALYNFVYSDNLQGYPNSTDVSYVTHGHSLDIPARAVYTLPLSKSLKVFSFAGPNFNIGLSQTMKVTSTLTYPPTSPFYIKSETVDLYKDDILNRVNLQIGLGGGIQWKKYQIKATYDFGLNNLNRTGSGNLHQKGWYFSVAYDF
jgi:hypothetical protein